MGRLPQCCCIVWHFGLHLGMVINSVSIPVLLWASLH